MRLGQIKADGGYLAAVFEGNLARAVPGYTVTDLIRRSETEGVPLAKTTARLASRHAEPHAPVLPIVPPEVWACGCTYERSASFRDAEHGTREGMYAYVYNQPRPEIFFKGTARVCVGPGQAIGIRADSRFTAPEPELALVLGSKGNVVGYTLANDVTARDLQKKDGQWTRAKGFDTFCAVGPLVSDEVDPQAGLTIETRLNGELRQLGSTADFIFRIPELLVYITAAFTLEPGDLVLTGTPAGVGPLNPGDRVDVSIPGLGVLTNTVEADRD